LEVEAEFEVEVPVSELLSPESLLEPHAAMPTARESATASTVTFRRLDFKREPFWLEGNA